MLANKKVFLLAKMILSKLLLNRITLNFACSEHIQPKKLFAYHFQGSHGFMTTHRWRDSIGAFINVEASGTGGPGI